MELIKGCCGRGRMGRHGGHVAQAKSRAWLWGAVKKGYLGGEGLEAVESNSGTLGGKPGESRRGERVEKGVEERKEERERERGEKKGKEESEEKKNNMR